jgi:hypothetical protein
MLAAKALNDLGFTDVTAVDMKFAGWVKVNNPIKRSDLRRIRRGATFRSPPSILQWRIASMFMLCSLCWGHSLFLLFQASLHPLGR